MMKKILSLVLCLSLIFATGVPAFGVTTGAAMDSEEMQSAITGSGINEEIFMVNAEATDLVSGDAVDLVSGDAVDLVSGDAIDLVSGDAIDLVSGDAIEVATEEAIEIKEYDIINVNSNNVSIIGKTKANSNEDYQFFIRIKPCEKITRFDMDKVTYQVNGGKWLKPKNFAGEFTIPKSNIVGEIRINAPVYNTYSSWTPLKGQKTYAAEAEGVKENFPEFGARSKPYALIDSSILSMEYVTQGQTVSEKNGILFLGHYHNGKKGASIIELIDMNTRQTIKAVRILNPDGSVSLSHMGGMLANDTHLWITSENALRKISIENILKAEDMGYVTIEEVIPSLLSATCGSYSNGMAWVGEYGSRDKGYVTDDTHLFKSGKLYGLNDTNEGLLMGYQLDKNGDNLSLNPEVVISIPRRIQGAAVGPNNEVILNGKDIYICDDYTKLPKVSRTLQDGKTYDVYIFDKDKLGKIITPITTFPLAQNISFLENGNVLINSEGSANKYLNAFVQSSHHVWEFNPMLTPETSNQYRIKVKTGDKAFAGSDSDVYMKIIGEKGETNKLCINKYIDGNFLYYLLDTDKVFSNTLEMNKTDTFTKSFDKNIGKIKAVEVTMKNWGASPDWLVDSITIDPICKGTIMDGGGTVKVNQWIAGGKAKLFELEETTQYKVTVKTGGLEKAGTDSDIFVKLAGENETTNEVEISGLVSGNAFEKNSMDTCNAAFTKLEGEMKSIEIRSNMTAKNAEWFLEYIKVEPVVNGEVDSSNAKTFTYNQWISDKKSKVIFDDNTNLTARYKVTVKTGNSEKAGTDSDIFIKLAGENETTNEVEISELVSGDAFEKNKTDTCNVTFSMVVGKVKAIEIRSDMTAKNAEWNLEYIKIEPIVNGVVDSSNAKTFTYKQWISDKKSKVIFEDNTNVMPS